MQSGSVLKLQVGSFLVGGNKGHGNDGYYVPFLSDYQDIKVRKFDKIIGVR